MGNQCKFIVNYKKLFVFLFTFFRILSYVDIWSAEQNNCYALIYFRFFDCSIFDFPYYKNIIFQLKFQIIFCFPFIQLICNLLFIIYQLYAIPKHFNITHLFKINPIFFYHHLSITFVYPPFPIESFYFSFSN